MPQAPVDVVPQGADHPLKAAPRRVDLWRVDGVSTPAPGWYPDPAGSPSYRWWDGGSWTAHLGVPEQAAAHVPSPVVATVATEYAGDPRFGGTGPATVDLSAAVPTPTAPPPSSAGRLRPDRPKSQLVAAAVAALAVLVGGVFAAMSLFGGNGASDADRRCRRRPARRGQPAGGRHAGRRAEHRRGGGQRLHRLADVHRRQDHQGPVQLDGRALRLSSAEETVQVAVSPSGTGYCMRAARTPAGGGAEQVLVYISTQGGFQPPSVVTCPPTF